MSTYSNSICAMKGFHTTTDLGEEAELLEPHIEYFYEQLKEIFALPFKERGIRKHL